MIDGLIFNNQETEYRSNYRKFSTKIYETADSRKNGAVVMMETPKIFASLHNSETLTPTAAM